MNTSTLKQPKRWGRMILAVATCCLAVACSKSTGPTITQLDGRRIAVADMERRIERHQAERPSHWATIEEQLDLESTITSIDRGLIIVDCLTLWTSNMMWHDRTDDEIRSAAADVSDVAHAHAGDVVVISNEVGLGIHPDNELGRRYRDVHGWVNQRWAQTADRSMFVVAGKAIVLDDPLQHLPFPSSPRSEPT